MALRWKILIPINLVLALGWGSYQWWHLSASRESHLTAEMDALRHLALGLRLAVEDARRRGLPMETLQRRLERLGRSFPGTEILLLDPRSVVVASNLRRRVGKPWQEADIAAVLAGKRRFLAKHARHDHDGVPAADVTLAVKAEDGRVVYAIHVARSLQELERQYRHLVAETVGATLLLLLVLGVLTSLLVYQLVLRPVGRLRRQMEESGWRTPEPIPVQLDEIGQLAATFQGLMEQVTRSTERLQGTIEQKDTLLTEVTDLRECLEEQVADTTEQLQQTEAALARAERFAALGQVSGALAHEVRNPLHIIRAAAELAGRRAPDCAEITADITEEVDRIARLIDTLLSFTRPVEVRPEPVDCAELLHDVVRKMEQSAEREGHPAVRWEIHADVPRHTLQADGLLLLQALVNLADNARAASRDDQLVRLTATLDPQCRVVFAVIDEGAGIAPDQAEHLFEPFVSGRASGTGLGLAIVQRIADLHHGQVRLTPVRPRGTRAELRLPMIAPQEPTP